MTITKLLKELREILASELDCNDFDFGIGFLTGHWDKRYGEYTLSDGTYANVDYTADGWRKIDKGDYFQPPEEHGEITIHIVHAEFYVGGEKTKEYDAPTNNLNENTVTIKY